MISRRKVQVSLPTAKAGLASMGTLRLQPNYSLNSIQPNPHNPRRPDLERHKITLARVKQLARKADESLDSFQHRVEEWITRTEELDAEARAAWDRLILLALSIADRGVMQPITVRLVNPQDTVATLVAGERRFLASWLAGMNSIHAIVRVEDNQSASALALLENTQRDDLSLPAVVQALLAMQAERDKPYSVREVARLTGYSRGSAGTLHKALALPLDHPIYRALEDGAISKVYHIQQWLDEKAPGATGEEGTDTSTAEPQEHPSLAASAPSQAEPAPPSLGSPPANKGHDWPRIQNWLAHRFAPSSLSQNGKGPQALSEEIAQIRSPAQLASFIERLAASEGGQIETHTD